MLPLSHPEHLGQTYKISALAVLLRVGDRKDFIRSVLMVKDVIQVLLCRQCKVALRALVRTEPQRERLRASAIQPLALSSLGTTVQRVNRLRVLRSQVCKYSQRLALYELLEYVGTLVSRHYAEVCHRVPYLPNSNLGNRNRGSFVIKKKGLTAWRNTIPTGLVYDGSPYILVS